VHTLILTHAHKAYVHNFAPNHSRNLTQDGNATMNIAGVVDLPGQTHVTTVVSKTKAKRVLACPLPKSAFEGDAKLKLSGNNMAQLRAAAAAPADAINNTGAGIRGSNDVPAAQTHAVSRQHGFVSASKQSIRLVGRSQDLTLAPTNHSLPITSR